MQIKQKWMSELPVFPQAAAQCTGAGQGPDTHITSHPIQQCVFMLSRGRAAQPPPHFSHWLQRLLHFFLGCRRQDLVPTTPKRGHEWWENHWIQSPWAKRFFYFIFIPVILLSKPKKEEFKSSEGSHTSYWKLEPAALSAWYVLIRLHTPVTGPHERQCLTIVRVSLLTVFLCWTICSINSSVRNDASCMCAVPWLRRISPVQQSALCSQE